MRIERLFISGAVTLAACALSAAVVVPQATVTGVSANARKVEVSYTLSAPAVVTFDVLTNGVPVGEENIFTADDGKPAVSGDICRELAADKHVFTWRSRAAWPGVRPMDVDIVLKAWPLNDKPPYMVVDLTNDETIAAADRIRYYASSNAVPGGIVANPAYKTTAMVFRRIDGRGRLVTKGSGTGKTTETLSNDYYLAVFETTQAQWRQVWKGNTIAQLFQRDGDGRPVDNTTYCYIRESKNNSQQTAYQYPNPPNPDSWLGNLRTLCGGLVDFDLPTVNEWIYAATCGYGYCYWGDGSPVTTSGGAIQSVCPNLGRLGRYAYNGGWVPTSNDERANVTTNDLEHGTAIVGTYQPNDFGIYDMHGNVLERVADVRNLAYGGDCHRPPNSCVPQSSGDEVGPTSGSYSYSRGTYAGFRVACRNGLK